MQLADFVVWWAPSATADQVSDKREASIHLRTACRVILVDAQIPKQARSRISQSTHYNEGFLVHYKWHELTNVPSCTLIVHVRDSASTPHPQHEPPGWIRPDEPNQGKTLITSAAPQNKMQVPLAPTRLRESADQLRQARFEN